jgi:hypothetical protein
MYLQVQLQEPSTMDRNRFQFLNVIEDEMFHQRLYMQQIASEIKTIHVNFFGDGHRAMPTGFAGTGKSSFGWIFAKFNKRK